MKDQSLGPKKRSAIMESTGISTGQRGESPETGWLCKSSQRERPVLLQRCFKHHKKPQLKSREQKSNFTHIILVIHTQSIISIQFWQLTCSNFGLPWNKDLNRMLVYVTSSKCKVWDPKIQLQKERENTIRCTLSPLLCKSWQSVSHALGVQGYSKVTGCQIL